uniref:Uncharacterized protein n=1 Tax=Anguilla anguilla TaxID=7936 RepID=A0A0E9XFW7_ANGAN
MQCTFHSGLYSLLTRYIKSLQISSTSPPLLAQSKQTEHTR